MASNSTLASTPLTFELPRSLVDHIHSCRGQPGLKSVSDVVRYALSRFDFAAFQAPPREQLQISVRLSPVQKRALFQHARRKKVSAGELLRAALESLAPASGSRSKSARGAQTARKEAPARGSAGKRR